VARDELPVSGHHAMMDLSAKFTQKCVLIFNIARPAPAIMVMLAWIRCCRLGIQKSKRVLMALLVEYNRRHGMNMMCCGRIRSKNSELYAALHFNNWMDNIYYLSMHHTVFVILLINVSQRDI